VHHAEFSILHAWLPGTRVRDLDPHSIEEQDPDPAFEFK